MKAVILRKNGSYAIVAVYTIADDAPVPDESLIEDGYYIVVVRVSETTGPIDSDMWAQLLNVDIARDVASAAKEARPLQNVRAVAN